MGWAMRREHCTTKRLRFSWKVTRLKRRDRLTRTVAWYVVWLLFTWTVLAEFVYHSPVAIAADRGEHVDKRYLFCALCLMHLSVVSGYGVSVWLRRRLRVRSSWCRVHNVIVGLAVFVVVNAVALLAASTGHGRR